MITKILHTLRWFLLSAAVLGMASCVPLLAGAAVGYVAHDEGYRVQSPVKKDE